MNTAQRLLLGSLLASAASTGLAQTNLLTAGDFEGEVPTSSYWAPAPGIWGGEHYNLTGDTNGVQALDDQMLEILHAGGGSAAQVHQIVEGPFVSGSEVSFQVSMNSHLAGVQAGLLLETRSAVNVGPTTRSANNYFLLDDDPDTWETFTVTQTLDNDTNFIAGEIVLWHSSLPIPWFTPGGYADNAVLTVVPPVTDADNDGVPDSADLCVNTNLDATVSVLGNDSGVENVVFAAGCSTSDLVTEVIDDCDNAGNHGKFASCVAKGLNSLLSSGVITGDEKDALQSAAAQTDVGKKNNGK